MRQQVGRWLILLVVILGLGAGILLSEVPRGGLTGTVLLPAGASRVTVVARSSDGRTVQRQLTSGGGFRLGGLPTGRYDLEVFGPGLQRLYRSGLEVLEGQNTPIGSLSLEYLEPRLSLYGTSRVFTSQERATVNLSAEGLTQAQISIYPFDLTDYLGTPTLAALADPYGFDFPNQEQITRQPPLHQWQQGIPDTGEDWSRITLNLPKLAPGAYLLTARGTGPTGQTVATAFAILVTDLGLVQKQDDQQVLIWTVDLASQQPLPNLPLTLYDSRDPQRVLARLVTDAQGLATWPLPAEGSMSWIVYGDGGRNRQAVLAGSRYRDQDALEFYTYTDRPLYRPGQTVYFRSIIRRRQPGTLAMPTTPVRVEIRDPRGNPIYEDSLLPNSFGTIHGQAVIPLESELGSYSLSLETEDGGYGYGSFQVEEYRKPEFAVTVTPERPWVEQGQDLKVAVKGEYLFGGPVANAQVRYRVYRSPDWFFREQVIPLAPEEAFFSADLAEERYGDYGGFGDLVLEGETTTDATGQAEILLRSLLRSFDWGSQDYWGGASVQELRIEVEMTDLSRRAVTATGRARVTQGRVAVFLDSEHYVVKPGERMPLTIRSYSYDREPVAVSGEVRLERWAWLRRELRYVKQAEILRVGFRTQQGEGTVTLELPADLPQGDYRIIASSGRAQDVQFIWVRGSGAWAGDSRQSLRVLADRQVYQVGDQAQIVITSPIPDAQVLLSVEGQRLLAAQVQQLQGQTLAVSLPILPRYQPNVFYKVLLLGPDRQIYEGQAQLYVSPLAQFLDVTISSDRPTYAPGDTAQITVTTRNRQGDPVVAEVSLGVVDEGIYLLRPDLTPDIRRFFYSRRYNRVSTSYSFPQQYPGGLDKLANQIRQDFRDTAAWFPNLVTNAQGIAQVSVKLPDNLTSWRLTAHAVTPDTQVGSARASVQVSKDLIARLATPRFFRTQDRLALTAVIDNKTDQPEQVRVTLETTPHITLSGSPTQTLTLPAQGSRRLEWGAEVVKAGSALVRVTAEGNLHRDAMQLTIPVQGFGAPVRRGFQGQGSADLNLDLPADLVPGSLEVSLRLATHPLGQLLGGVDYLVEFPYGCIEQTLSRFLPALAVQRLAEDLGISIEPQTQERLPQMTRAALRRLQRFQHYDGGWGWWEWDESNPYLTAYVVLGYQRAQAAGYPVSETSLGSALEYLGRQLNNPQLSSDTRAFVAYALRQPQPLDPATLSTWGASYEILTLLANGQTQAARQRFTQVLGPLNASRWFQPPQKTSGSPDLLWQRPRFTDTEVAGSLLQAAVQLQDPWADLLAAWLLNQSWGTTKATADALLGLSAYYQAQTQINPPDFRLTLSQGSRILHEWIPSPGDPYRSLRLTDAELSDQPLRLTQTGSGNLFYSLSLSATSARPVAPQAQGFQISRRYFLVRPGGKASPLTGSVAPGSLVMAKLTVTTDQPRRYVMLEDPLPSGAEVSSQSRPDGQMDYGWDWFWTEQTVRDDRVTFFVTGLPAGTHEFIYVFRPEIPGTFQVNPALVEEMYDPQVFGSSGTDVLKVG
ncbi:MAG: MG2 domain-containing protein [Thermostichales cyanobacterium BF4_bins_65]